jgi:subtilisin family serine protease
MPRHRSLLRRPLLLAVAGAGVIATSAATSGAASLAGPTPHLRSPSRAAAAPAANTRLAQGLATTAGALPGVGSAAAVLPRVDQGSSRPTGGPAAGGRPTGVPASGGYGFLLKLSATPTLTTFRQAAQQGEAVARTAAKAQLQRVVASQNQVIAALPSGSHVLYRLHAVMSGVGVYTNVRNYSALQHISGVSAIYPIAPKSMSNSYAVPLQGAPTVWTNDGDLGQNSTIAVIDTGIDYTHADFGGPGTVPAYSTAKAGDASPADPSLFPSSKIIGGYDLAGDAYDANPADSTFDPTPAPDPNPLDCNGHGTHVAGTAAGLGENADGSTYSGSYDTNTPFSTMRIGPGMAPVAKLLSYKVFGCTGDTDLVSAAIDMAADPNGDGDPSDHANVINMSLGGDFASPQDADAATANAAAALGISVVAASGNGGDYYDVGGSPGNAVRAIAVANSVDAYSQLDALNVTAPAGIAASYGAERSIAYDWTTGPDLSGDVAEVLQPGNLDACDPLDTADSAAVAGKIAFVEWTDDDTTRRCGSAARAANLVTAGATGFIYADDEETFEAGITGSATIPGVLVTKSAGDAIRAQLQAAATVTVAGTTANGFPQLIPSLNDELNASSSRGIGSAGDVKPDVTAVGTSVFSAGMGTGDEGLSDTGTSMATPMVAGLAALVNSAHPNWTSEQVKADIMNTADQDVFTGPSHTGTRYAPNRVGAGRIDAAAALDNQVLAYVTNDPGAVSVSFGALAVTGPTVRHQTINVVNTGLAAASFQVSYQALTTIPGVGCTVSPATISVDARSTKTVTLTLSIADPRKLTKTIDPTIAREQDGLPREYLADASGRVLCTPTAGATETLRVPVYAAPRPASQMTQAASVTLPGGANQQGLLRMSGRPVDQGSGDTAIKSIMAGFELQGVSGAAPTCTTRITSACVSFPDERSSDLRYVAVTSDAPQLRANGQNVKRDGLVYFSITTEGPWRTAASANEIDVLIDLNGDGVPDVAVFNTRYDGQDIPVAETVDLNSGDVLDIEPLDDTFGNVDTALFNSDTMVMPVAISALTPKHGSRLSYAVAGFSIYQSTPVDEVGFTSRGTTGFSFDPLHPGVAVFGSYDGSQSSLLFRDAPGEVLEVVRDKAAYVADRARGALIVHFRTASATKPSASSSRPARPCRCDWLLIQ